MGSQYRPDPISGHSDAQPVPAQPHVPALVMRGRYRPDPIYGLSDARVLPDRPPYTGLIDARPVSASAIRDQLVFKFNGAPRLFTVPGLL